MTTRAPIHLGSGEPVLLLHPFLLSQAVWEAVAQQLADTGRFEVFWPGVGAGLRLKFNKFSKTNICIDYAFGLNGSKGLFLNLGEVF